ncbi:MAG: hypothetical protein H7Y18_08530, partial [Clostridiaceae bacterium]|nr:hypothetical protein [Clostridiaceae bacterium]
MMNLKRWQVKAKRFLSTGLIACMLIGMIVPTSVYAASGTVNIDYNNTIATGHPAVFGGVGNGNSNPAKIQELKDSGFKTVRVEAWIEHLLDMTNYNDYKNNVNNIQNPDNWNWSGIDSLNIWYDKGYEVMLLINGAPEWLTYSGTIAGVPKDWAVYEDIVKKIFQRYQGKVTYVEVWNEPDNQYALNLNGSPYQEGNNHPGAYNEIFYHVTNAVRSVDINKTVKLGGPALAGGTGWPAYVTYILDDSRNRDNFEFISFHVYNGTGNISNAVNDWRSWAADRGKPNLPVFITEWNDDASVQKGGDGINTTGNESISYVGIKLNDMLKVGTEGSYIFTIGEYQTGYPFWQFYDQNGNISPKIKTYRLMSNKLGLGDGDSSIKNTSYSNITSALGAINSQGEKIGVLVNSDTVDNTVSITLKNTGLANGTASIEVYEASVNNDSNTLRETKSVTVDNGTISTTISVPANSVVGFKVKGTDSRVFFYQDGNYGGTVSSGFGVGNYTLTQLVAGGAQNDWMSSLKIPNGWTVEVYQNDNFGGTKWTFTSNTGDVGANCNDNMSSVKIINNSSTNLFNTGFEDNETLPTWADSVDGINNVSGYLSGINPECSIRSISGTNELAHSGTKALMFSGTDTSTSTSFCYYKVFDVNINISTTTKLSYWFMPQTNNARYLSVDLICTDGTTLRDI